MTALAPGGLFVHLAQLPIREVPTADVSSFARLRLRRLLCGQSFYAAVAPWARHQPAEFLHALGVFRRPPTAISLLRLSGVNKIAEALRENLYRVAELLVNLGILNL